MKTSLALSAKLADPTQIVTGVLATYHVFPDMPEYLQQAGMDYMIVDLEHGAYSDQLVADVCATGRRIGFAVIIRGVSTDYALVRRLIDFGPCGLMFPCVESTQQLDEVQRAIHMPPRGQRRPGGPANHWMPGFQYADWKAIEDALLIWPQIESKRGLANVDAIAAHPIVTSMAIGPYDLSAELGCCWDPTSPALRSAVQQVQAAATRAGKTTWFLGDPAQMVKDGFRLLCVGEPMVMLKMAAQRAVEIAKGQAQTQKAAASEHG
jgi:2-keto-3-deoxy-L-rhamnonate aldolase RhmA